MKALLRHWAQAHVISNAQMLYRCLGMPVGSPIPPIPNQFMPPCAYESPPARARDTARHVNTIMASRIMPVFAALLLLALAAGCHAQAPPTDPCEWDPPYHPSCDRNPAAPHRAAPARWQHAAAPRLREQSGGAGATAQRCRPPLCPSHYHRCVIARALTRQGAPPQGPEGVLARRRCCACVPLQTRPASPAMVMTHLGTTH